MIFLQYFYIYILQYLKLGKTIGYIHIRLYLKDGNVFLLLKQLDEDFKVNNSKNIKFGNSNLFSNLQVLFLSLV